MVRLRCADRLGASAYPVCRVGRKRRTEGCRAVCRGGSGWGNGFQPGRIRGVGTAAESFFKGMPPGMCGEASIREYGEYHCRMPSGMCGEARGGTPQGIFPKRRFRLDAGYGGR